MVVYWWEHSPPTDDAARVRFPDLYGLTLHAGSLLYSSLLCSERFSPGYSSFPLSSRTYI